MLRLATNEDLKEIGDLVLEFLSATSYNKHVEHRVNIQHIRKLVFNVFMSGWIWVYTKEDDNGEVIVGMLAAVKEPNMWVPTAITVRELIWYVKAEQRNSTVGGKLFIAFMKHCDKLIQDKKIAGYFTTRMSTTADYDLEKRGFRMTEKLYLKDEVI